MTYSGTRLLWCVICGVPIFHKGLEEAPSWLKDAVLLGDADTWPVGRWPSESKDDILEIKAILTSGESGKFEALATGERVGVCDDDWYNIEHKEADRNNSLLFLPVHAACLHIAKEVIRTRSKLRNTNEYIVDLAVTSMRRLWEALQARFMAMKCTQQFWYIPYIFGPHQYDMEGSINLYDWETSSWHFNKVYGADPLDISNLTWFILSDLRQIPDNNSSQRGIDKTLAQSKHLPQEIIDHVIFEMAPFKNPSLECTRLMAQEHWFRGLSKGRLLPLLWDVDVKVYDKAWDYELLVRKVAQDGFLDIALKSRKDVPLGLRNRCRIWKLLEEMYVGDVSPDSLY